MNREQQPAETPPDLQTQLEYMLHAVWEQEKMQREEDRINLAVRLNRDTDETLSPAE